MNSLSFLKPITQEKIAAKFCKGPEDAQEISDYAYLLLTPKFWAVQEVKSRDHRDGQFIT